MGESTKSKIGAFLIIAYFCIGLFEVMSEFFRDFGLIYVFKPLLTVILCSLYFNCSSKRSIWFFTVMLFSLITNILFIPNTQQMLFYALIAFLVHRVLIIIYITRLIHMRDFIPTLLATIPFLIVFFYLLMVTPVPEESLAILVLQNILISVLCGICFGNYMMNDNRRNSWLLISGIFFGALQFIVFIEKFYLLGISTVIFRPIAMGLNVFAFYTFYEFVITTERSHHNAAPVANI